MESEAASSTKIAINLMIISGLVFSIIILVNIAKPNLFDRVLWIVNVTEEEKAKQFDDYDQKWVSGSKVLRALRLYEDSEFGIVYSTKKTQANGNYGMNFGGIFKEATNSYQFYIIYNFDTWKTKKQVSDTFYTKEFKFDSSGKIVTNDKKNITRHLESDYEYIAPDGRFKAELIRDITNEIIGICFTQE